MLCFSDILYLSHGSSEYRRPWFLVISLTGVKVIAQVEIQAATFLINADCAYAYDNEKG